MSSFRRRAIVVTRARSAERRSTGGRVSARTTAAASNGSASIRSHASASRTSGRAKNDASPATRNGTLRSSSAAATSLPCRQPDADDHADPLGQGLAGREAAPRSRARPPGPARARPRSARSAPRHPGASGVSGRLAEQRPRRDAHDRPEPCWPASSTSLGRWARPRGTTRAAPRPAPRKRRIAPSASWPRRRWRGSVETSPPTSRMWAGAASSSSSTMTCSKRIVQLLLDVRAVRSGAAPPRAPGRPRRGCPPRQTMRSWRA